MSTAPFGASIETLSSQWSKVIVPLRLAASRRERDRASRSRRRRASRPRVVSWIATAFCALEVGLALVLELSVLPESALEELRRCRSAARAMRAGRSSGALQPFVVEELRGCRARELLQERVAALDVGDIADADDLEAEALLLGDRALALRRVRARGRGSAAAASVTAPATCTLVAATAACCASLKTTARRLLRLAVRRRPAAAAGATTATSANARSPIRRRLPMRTWRTYRTRPTAVASPRWRRAGIHHVGVAVVDLDEAVATYERLFGGRLEHRARVEEQGVEAASMRVGESRVELLAALGDDTPVGRFLAKRGPGHAPRRLSGRRRRGRARTSSPRAGRRADRRPCRGAGCSGSRSRSCIRSRFTAFSRRWCRVAEDERVRVEIGFEGGQVVGGFVDAGVGRSARARAARGRAARRRARAARTAGTTSSCRGSPISGASAAPSRVGFGAG